MESLDEWIARAADSGSLAVVLLVGVLLGPRHSTNRDHLTADRRRPPAWPRPRAGARLACRARNTATLFAFGMPIALFAGARRHWLCRRSTPAK